MQSEPEQSKPELTTCSRGLERIGLGAVARARRGAAARRLWPLVALHLAGAALALGATLLCWRLGFEAETSSQWLNAAALLIVLDACGPPNPNPNPNLRAILTLALILTLSPIPTLALTLTPNQVRAAAPPTAARHRVRRVDGPAHGARPHGRPRRGCKRRLQASPSQAGRGGGVGAG